MAPLPRPRCVYLRKDGEQCGRRGAGSPPLCAQHLAVHEAGNDDLIVNVINTMFAQPRVQEILGGLRGHIDKFASRIDDYASGKRPPPPHFRVAAPPPPDPTLAARATLGFDPDDKLTVELVKARKKILAKTAHPDHGGDAAWMAKVNRAADVLLASLR